MPCSARRSGGRWVCPRACVVGFGYIPPGDAEPTIANAVDANTGIFGFHMWAEAWIGPDEWVPMDAALDGFDVGHIAITKSALEEVNPIVDLNTPVLNLMQSMKIEIVKTVTKEDMPPVRAPGGAATAPPRAPVANEIAPVSPGTPAPTEEPSAPVIAHANAVSVRACRRWISLLR